MSRGDEKLNIKLLRKHRLPRCAKADPDRFCLESSAIRKIILDADIDRAKALSTYAALCSIASDHQHRARFSASHRDIAALAGFPITGVKRVLPNLVRLGLVTVESQPMT